MAELIVLDELYAYLLAERIGQQPDARPIGALPSLWLRPRDGGIPEPRVDDEVIVMLTDPFVGRPSPNEPWLEETFIEVTTRSRSANAGRLLHRIVRQHIAPEDRLGGRRQWQMGAILVEYSTLWRSEQELPQIDGDTYLRRQSFRFAVRTKVLRGA